MIIAPANQEQWNLLAQFLQEYAGVRPGLDLQMMGWITDNQVKVVVGFNSFVGKVCQMHVAMTKGYEFSPRELLRATFEHAFDKLKVKKVIGIVDSTNLKAMRYDAHLGFVEEHRMPGMHDDGDLVVLGMTREQCRFLEKKDAPQLLCA